MSDTNDLNARTEKNNKNKTIRLDNTFPHVWILSAAVVLIIILMVISGYKIVHLDQERQH